MTPIESAVQTLRSTHAAIQANPQDPKNLEIAGIIAARNEVIARYGPAFSPENIANLDSETFRSFLLFKNNHHWSNMQRQGGSMTADMPRLREAIGLLVNEGLTLKTRLDRLRPASGQAMIKGLSRAVITPILQVVYPDKYGVWNSTSKAGMTKLKLWPELPWGASFSETYEAINHVLLDLAARLQLDLWTLDALWWRIADVKAVVSGSDVAEPATENDGPADEDAETSRVAPDVSFGLERQLQNFLVDNWSKTELGKDWTLLEEDGEITGDAYKTAEVGEIDLLARHKTENRWLVIELKRGNASDVAVGQLLRYMGWVRRNLASDGGRVEGRIICRDIDKKMQYALDGLADVRCMTYQVSFSLAEVPGL